MRPVNDSHPWSTFFGTRLVLSVSETTVDADMKGLLGATLAILGVVGLVYTYRTLNVSRLPKADGLSVRTLHVSPPPRCQGVTITCNSGRPTSYTRHGDVEVPNVPEMCFPEGDLFFSVKVSPKQYLQYSRCPTIAYEIDKTGRVSRVQTVASSGSREIDSIAMDVVKARSFTMPQHCNSCRMETRVEVDF